MKKLLLALFLILFSATAALSQTDATSATGPYLFKANEVKIYVPSPTDRFVEAGYVSSGFLWNIVRDEDQSNGLFVLKGDFNDVMDGVSNADIKYSKLSKYARVQIQDKDKTFNPANFKKAVDSTKKEVGDSFPSNIEEPEKMLIKRLQALDLRTGKLQERTSLGRLFSSPNAYSYCVLIKDTADGKLSYIIAGFTMVHVKDKMLVAYLYANYENPNTLKWLKETSEQWSISILKTNQQTSAELLTYPRQ